MLFFKISKNLATRSRTPLNKFCKLSCHSAGSICRYPYIEFYHLISCYQILKSDSNYQKNISFTKSLFYKRESHVCKDKRRIPG